MRDDEAPAAGNAENLDKMLNFLDALIAARLAEAGGSPAPSLPQPAFVRDDSPFAAFVEARHPQFDAFTLIALALAPHIGPTRLDRAFRAALKAEGDFPEIGGVRDEPSRAFVPTGETAAFLLAGADLDARFHVQRLLEPDGWLAAEGIVRLEPARDGTPHLSGRLVMGRDWIGRFTTGSLAAPAFGAEFPARRIATALTWDDLVLTETSRAEIAAIETWLRHGAAFRSGWGMEGRIRPGFRALFHGPPGTGKTLTATLIGKAAGREVYRIDLSAVVSKYIGETEKNLSLLFDRAERRDWVLFFDEADALFGKRTAVKDAHDRYANQEVSYLLQRVEEFDGLVILASNFRANLDDAFLRRFNAIVRFPMPGPAERRAIWQCTLPARPGHEGLPGPLARFELSGGNIVNVVGHAGVVAEARGAAAISLEDAVRGVAAEMEKEGRVFKNLCEAETGPL